MIHITRRMLVVALAALGMAMMLHAPAVAAIGNPSPPPTSTAWSVTSTNKTANLPKAESSETWRVRNNADGKKVKVQKLDKDGDGVGNPADLDPGDSTDFELAKGERVQVKYADGDSSGTGEKL